MERIFSAIFDNRRDADAAIAELIMSGYPRAAIRLDSGDPAGGAHEEAAGGRAGAIADESGSNFFHTLFGTDDSVHVRHIDGAVTRSHLVLTVALDSLIDVENAAAIVERYGPTDIDAIAVGAASGSGAARAAVGHGAQYQGGAPSQQKAEPPGADHGAAPTPWRDAGNLQRAAGAAGETYPGDEHYDEYAPAYLYGLDMATHEQHGGKEWQEAEPALQSEWERRHPHSAWDTFRHAVRHGWDKLRGGGHGA